MRFLNIDRGFKSWLGGLCAAIFAVLSISAANAQIFTANYDLGTVGEYNLDGTVVNNSLVSIDGPGAAAPWGIAVSGTDIFVANPGLGTVGEYSTSGDIVNTSLISGLGQPYNIAISGSDMFVAGSSGIGEYSTSGTPINSDIIPDSDYPVGIVVCGSNVFVANYNAGTIGEYLISGTTASTVNASLVSGLSEPEELALSGSDLFVANEETGEIGEYTTSGTTVTTSLFPGISTNGLVAVSGSDLLICYSDASSESTIGAYTLSGDAIDPTFITNLPNNTYPTDLAVVGTISPVPEPSTLAMLIGSLGLPLFLRRRSAAKSDVEK